MPYYADDPMCLLGVEMNVPDNVWIGAQELAALRARVAELEKVAEAAADYRAILTNPIVHASIAAALTSKGLEQKAAQVLDATLAALEADDE